MVGKLNYPKLSQNVNSVNRVQPTVFLCNDSWNIRKTLDVPSLFIADKALDIVEDIKCPQQYPSTREEHKRKLAKLEIFIMYEINFISYIIKISSLASFLLCSIDTSTDENVTNVC